MILNILLTSLDALDNDLSLKYYSVKNELGFNYCEAMQSMEASAKYILSRTHIDGILVIGGNDPAGRENDRKITRLKDASALNSEDPTTLSAYDLYLARLLQHVDEVSLVQQVYDELLPEETRAKVIDFIRGFQERESKKLNRLFDELACDQQLYERFREALFYTFSENHKDYLLIMMWANNYLYKQLKASAKLEILPENENPYVMYLTADMLEKREHWVNSILGKHQDEEYDDYEINLFVTLGNDSAVDSHVLLNMLDIQIATPGSAIHLKKIYRVFEPASGLTGYIDDNTAVSITTDIVVAAHAFLNYSKTDMLVNFWETYGDNDERINRLIYATRHVDTGISMCNIPEVQKGIDLLRELSRDNRPWSKDSYSLLFGVLVGCIQADYKPLLEGDGNISFIELIKWAYRHQLYQQVLTLIESHAPTHMVESGIFYYCNDEANVPEVTKLFALQRMGMKPYEYYKIENLEHYFIKQYDRANISFKGRKQEDRNLAYALLRAQSINKQVPGKIPAYSACKNMETVKNVLYSYYHLGMVRNKISHADLHAMAERRPVVSIKDESFAVIWMKETIEYFINSFEKALEEVSNKKPKIVYISPDDVQILSERIKNERISEIKRRQSERRD